MKLKRKRNVILSFFLAIMTVVMTCTFTASNKCHASQSTVVPRATEIPAVATMELSSQTLLQGQNVNVTVSNNFYYNNSLVIPLGSSINGTVTMTQKADKNGNDGKFSILFTNITTPHGSVIPISGMLKTDDNTGIIYGNVTKDNTTEIVKGAAKGSVTGAYLDRKHENRTIQTGCAIGAGMGASSSTKGRSAVITVGSVVNIVLNQQATFVPVQGYQY